MSNGSRKQNGINDTSSVFCIEGKRFDSVLNGNHAILIEIGSLLLQFCETWRLSGSSCSIVGKNADGIRYRDICISIDITMPISHFIEKIHVFHVGFICL